MQSSNMEFQQNKVRQKLREEDIKLWLPPYTTEAQEQGEIPLDLIKKYSKDLSMDEDSVAIAIENLRKHAVAKLAASHKFKTTGIATIKVKLAGGKQDLPNQMLTLEISLDILGDDLKQAVSIETGLDKVQIKLICAGKVIIDSHTLCSQNVKNACTVMAVVLSDSEVSVRQEEEQMSDLKKTRQAAELLSTRAENDDVDDVYVQIADQNGQSLALPREERRALTLALTLHEKGRAALKVKNYSKALLLLLEADKEFGSCRAQILDSVDNFAILCLDIVWCYLCLENVNELPDAVHRLNKCEAAFMKSYGVNNERLKTLKNGAEAERILLMRLHLLQGIVAFHQHRAEASRQLLRMARDEYNCLQVNPEALAELMALGFTDKEARLGMRSCAGNVAAAAEFVIKLRQDRTELAKKEKEEREDRKFAKKYGNCANGEKLNMKMVRMMMQMQFPRPSCAEALKQTNNDIAKALDILHEHPELLEIPDVADNVRLEVSDADIAQLACLGFDTEAVKKALRKHKKNIQRALDDLLKFNGNLPYLSDDSSSSSSSGDDAPRRNKREEENKVLDELISDINTDETDHLDLEMTEERQFLDEYLTRLSSLL